MPTHEVWVGLTPHAAPRPDTNRLKSVNMSVPVLARRWQLGINTKLAVPETHALVKGGLRALDGRGDIVWELMTQRHRFICWIKPHLKQIDLELFVSINHIILPLV